MGSLLSIDKRIIELRKAKIKAYLTVILLYILVGLMFAGAFWIHPGFGIMMLALWAIYYITAIKGVGSDNGDDGSDDGSGDSG